MNDYTDKYVQGNHFDLPGLINDDFVLAIKQAYNSKFYISALKLLMCFLDTISFTSSGDSSAESFKRWVAKYIDLFSLGITADELWEHRNALLHMSHYDSRRVEGGKVTRLVPYVGKRSPRTQHEKQPFRYYSLHQLLVSVGAAVGKFIEDLERDNDLLKVFCTHYELTMSDSHLRADLHEPVDQDSNTAPRQ